MCTNIHYLALIFVWVTAEPLPLCMYWPTLIPIFMTHIDMKVNWHGLYSIRVYLLMSLKITMKWSSSFISLTWSLTNMILMQQTDWLVFVYQQIPLKLTCRSLEWIQQCYMNRFKIFLQICTRQHTFNKTDCDLSIPINSLT